MSKRFRMSTALDVDDLLLECIPYAIKLAKQSQPGSRILINLSGRGDKDLDFILKKIGKEY